MTPTGAAREHDAVVTETSDFVFTIKLISERSVEAAGFDVTQGVLSALAIALAEGVYERGRNMRAWREPAVSAERDHYLGANALRQGGDRARATTHRRDREEEAAQAGNGRRHPAEQMARGARGEHEGRTGRRPGR